MMLRDTRCDPDAPRLRRMLDEAALRDGATCVPGDRGLDPVLQSPAAPSGPTDEDPSRRCPRGISRVTCAGGQYIGTRPTLTFSVGGCDLDRNISPNLVRAVQHAKSVGAAVIGVVGRDGGYTASVADACVVVSTVNPAMITPHTESFQAVEWHLLVSDPRLQAMSNKWESSV
jgi:hypothetical protein